MLNVHTERHIRIIKGENAHAFIIAAVVVETREGQTVVVGEPRILKIIPKQGSTLPGRVTKTRALAGQIRKETIPQASLVSPYISFVYTSEKHDIPWYYSRPPTLVG